MGHLTTLKILHFGMPFFCRFLYVVFFIIFVVNIACTASTGPINAPTSGSFHFQICKRKVIFLKELLMTGCLFRSRPDVGLPFSDGYVDGLLLHCFWAFHSHLHSFVKYEIKNDRPNLVQFSAHQELNIWLYLNTKTAIPGINNHFF